MSKFFKELIFFLFFLVLIILAIGIVFYEFIPNQIIPEATKYEQSSGTENLLSQIQQEGQETDDENTILKTYKVSSENTSSNTENVEYEQGKNYPFYDYTKATEEQSKNTEDDKKENKEETEDKESKEEKKDDSEKENNNLNIDIDDSDVPYYDEKNNSQILTNLPTTEKKELNNSKKNENKIDTSVLRDTSNSNKTSK